MGRTVEFKDITVDGAGAADVTVPLRPGVVEAIAIDRGAWGAAVDHTFTESFSGEAILTVANMAAAKDMWRPRTLVDDQAGAPHASQRERPAVIAGIRVVIAGGVALSKGRVYFLLDQ